MKAFTPTPALPRPDAWLRLLLLVLLPLGGACSDRQTEPNPRPEASPDAGPGADTRPTPYLVVATTGMVGDIVGAVAGDHARIQTLIGAGVDPHLYKPTRNDVAALMRADVIFYSGLMLEGKMAEILASIGRNRPVHAVTQLIDPSYLIKAGDQEISHPDPHVWMDVQAWMAAVDAVARALSTFDPAHATDYAANALDYRAQLAALHDYAKATIAGIPAPNRVLITAHDAFHYFGRAYGIEVLGIQGLSTESEAGLEDIRRLIDTLVDRQIGAVFVESSVPDKNVRALIEGAHARGHTVRIGGELFSDAMGPANTYEGSYIGMLDHNVTTIARALGGAAPAGGMQAKLAHPQPTLPGE